MDQPGKTAAATAAGSSPAMMGPTYGTKRSIAPTTPHSTGEGTPITMRPTAMIAPNVALMPSWARK